MNASGRYNLVLAIYPNARGFAFVLFEGPMAPVDWGVVEVRGKNKNKRCLKRIRLLLATYPVALLILQDTSDGATLRGRRIRQLNRAIEEWARGRQLTILTYSRDDVRNCFAALGGVTKQDIAETIAKGIPAFERHVPPPRKIWMSEHARMGLFDAVALAWTFFHTQQTQIAA